MALTTAEMTKIGLRYAQALLDVAESAKQTTQVTQDLQALEKAVAEQGDLRAFIANPLLTASQQDGAVQAIGQKAKLSDLTVNFLRALAANGRLSALPQAITAFYEEAQRRAGVQTAEVASAYKLTAAQQESLEKALAQVAGGKVVVNACVDKTLLGGLTIRLGSQVIDDSVAGRLQRLRTALTGAAANAN